MDITVFLFSFQKPKTTTSDIVVNWDSFVDVEEENYAVHHSGIQSYDVAIGQFSYLIFKLLCV